MSNIVILLAEFRAFLREVQDNQNDPVLQMALDAAQEQVETFIGFSLDEFEGEHPAVIKQCICTLAMLMVDEFTPEKSAQLQGEVERALRPYRREPGVRAG